MLYGAEYTHVQVFKAGELDEAAGSDRGVTLMIGNSLPFCLYGKVDIYLGAIDKYKLSLIGTPDSDIPS